MVEINGDGNLGSGVMITARGVVQRTPWRSTRIRCNNEGFRRGAPLSLQCTLCTPGPLRHRQLHEYRRQTGRNVTQREQDFRLQRGSLSVDF